MKPVDMRWREKMQNSYEVDIKQISMIDMASKKSRKQANKQKGKQAKKPTKVVSARDKCRFRLDVHNFIVLKHGRHTS